MRLIDADKLRKDVLDLPNCPNGFSDTYDKAMILGLVDEQPTVDVEPVRHGRWEDEPSIYGNGFYKCSVCGEEWSYWWARIVPIDRMNIEMKYCPHCGARMGGKRRD